MNRANMAFRSAVQEVWHAAHERRRRPDFSEIVTVRFSVESEVERGRVSPGSRAFSGGQGEETPNDCILDRRLNTSSG